MKILNVFFISLLSIISLNLSAQIYVNSSGLVGIRLSNNNPYGSIDVYGGIDRFEYLHRPMDFVLQASDPRICSDNKIVFYNIYGTDWIDIECRNLFEKSDSSRKTNFQNIEKGLGKIKKLKGFTYNWKENPTGQRHAGLIAQQVERVIPEVITTVDSTNEKLLNYSGLIPYLIEAIKEQQNQIEELQKKFSESSSSTLKSTSTINSLEDNDNSLTVNAILYQNIPNPFTANTEIKFYLPEKVNSAALYIYDMQGHQIKSIPIYDRGNSSTIIYGHELQAGMYFYSLITDNKEIDTKRMILTD